ncbi:GCN5 family acetyltransferase [Hyphomicrobium nitrativorans NL23]|uniref:GCN5 family acetyltransferase n=2 Tax=Hyphomicrobium TaxID=81 RepID=V5SGB9_9HYPH|nr:GCN5 family acetyltransferase [Hyphomicrobium nitrativorans NL23]
MGSIPPFFFLSSVGMLWTSKSRTSTPKPIKTRRLVLRALVPGDAREMALYAGDWDVARMTARIPYPYSEALAEQWMDSLEPGEDVRVITLGGELIGAVGYMPQPDGTAEIGYWIGKPWWGNGYATEAARALVRYCFGKGGYAQLTCAHFVDNPGSARVIRKLGFTPLEETSPVWCDARQAEVETQWYELKRPLMGVLWRRRS